MVEILIFCSSKKPPLPCKLVQLVCVPVAESHEAAQATASHHCVCVLSHPRQVSPMTAATQLLWKKTCMPEYITQRRSHSSALKIGSKPLFPECGRMNQHRTFCCAIPRALGHHSYTSMAAVPYRAGTRRAVGPERSLVRHLRTPNRSNTSMSGLRCVMTGKCLPSMPAAARNWCDGDERRKACGRAIGGAVL